MPSTRTTTSASNNLAFGPAIAAGGGAGSAVSASIGICHLPNVGPNHAPAIADPSATGPPPTMGVQNDVASSGEDDVPLVTDVLAFCRVQTWAACFVCFFVEQVLFLSYLSVPLSLFVSRISIVVGWLFSRRLCCSVHREKDEFGVSP